MNWLGANNLWMARGLRLIAAWLAAAVGLFLLHKYLTLAHAIQTGALLFCGYAGAFAAASVWVLRTPHKTPQTDAAMYANWAAYIVRAAYWAVLLIGLADMLISYLRVEDMLAAVTGKTIALLLGRPAIRGLYVHYPLLAAACIVAYYARGVGFIWLTLLVVLAEFQVVLSGFVFSYEQAFMGDLVRFWYAALFLFASAYTLAFDGHVRVDVLYARFSERGKAYANALGALALGLPVCWTILAQGLSSRGSSLAGPLLGFEISQSGYGMYVKYWMAGFLIVFAVSMALQFVSVWLGNMDTLRAGRRAD